MTDLADTFISENKIIFNKYKPIKKIGNGSFSDIYSVINLKDKQYYALKSEKIKSSKKLLESEDIIYLFLKDLVFQNLFLLDIIKNIIF